MFQVCICLLILSYLWKKQERCKHWKLYLNKNVFSSIMLPQFTLNLAWLQSYYDICKFKSVKLTYNFISFYITTEQTVKNENYWSNFLILSTLLSTSEKHYHHHSQIKEFIWVKKMDFSEEPTFQFSTSKWRRAVGDRSALWTFISWNGGPWPRPGPRHRRRPPRLVPSTRIRPRWGHKAVRQEDSPTN